MRWASNCMSRYAGMLAPDWRARKPFRAAPRKDTNRRAATAGSGSNHHLADIAGPISGRCLTPSAWAQTPCAQLDVVREPGDQLRHDYAPSFSDTLPIVNPDAVVERQHAQRNPSSKKTGTRGTAALHVSQSSLSRTPARWWHGRRNSVHRPTRFQPNSAVKADTIAELRQPMRVRPSAGYRAAFPRAVFKSARSRSTASFAGSRVGGGSLRS